MKLRYGLVLIMALGAACGDDDTAASNGGAGKGSTGSNTKNLSAADVAAGACNMMQSSGSNSCEGIEEYSDCLQTACEDAYKTCLGAGYKSGNFSGGKCETYLKCVSSSADKCENNCGTPTGDCLNCFTSEFTDCGLNSNCPLPDCSGSSGNAGSGTSNGSAGTGINLMSDKTCDDLKACCDSLSGMNQSLCMQGYDSAKTGGDTVCGAIYTTFMALGCK